MPLPSFQEFAGVSESVFKNSDRRNDLDKAYHHLIRVLFENIERMAEEHQKTPRAVIMMGESAGDGTVGSFVSAMPCCLYYLCSVIYCTISMYRRVIFSNSFRLRLMPFCFFFLFFPQKTIIICLVSIEFYKKN